MMMPTGPLLLLLLSVATASYVGHKVLRVLPKTQHQLNFLRDLLDDGMYDVWQEPTVVGGAVDVLVTPRDLPSVITAVLSQGMNPQFIVSDVQRRLDEHEQENKAAYLEDGHRWTKYHDYPDIYEWLETKATDCGPRCRIDPMGYSFEGRYITLIKIGTPSAEPKQSIWIDAGIHAREWIAPAVATYIIERLIDDYDTDKNIKMMVDKYDWYIQPIVNVDGYQYSFTDERLWRRTRSVNESVPDCVGADANRNFDFKWMTIGASDNPCSNTFAGYFPFSEPETRAQRDYILGHTSPWLLFITLHSHAQKWMLPWGYTKEDPEDYEEMMAAGEVAVKSLESVYGTDYEVGSASHILYQSSGTSRDWAKGVPKFPYVYTVELRDKGEHGFLLPPEQILPSCIETWKAVYDMMLYIDATRK